MSRILWYQVVVYIVCNKLKNLLLFCSVSRFLNLLVGGDFVGRSVGNKNKNNLAAYAILNWSLSLIMRYIPVNTGTSQAWLGCLHVWNNNNNMKNKSVLWPPCLWAIKKKFRRVPCLCNNPDTWTWYLYEIFQVLKHCQQETTRILLLMQIFYFFRFATIEKS